MVFDYFPGCTLKTTGKQLDIYGRAAMNALGVELLELSEWQCCGATYPLANDEIATRLSAARALKASKENQRELVTLCSACHHVIKRTNNDIRKDAELRTKIRNYIGSDFNYDGETNVLHYMEVLRDRIGFEVLKEKVKKPLNGKRIGAYYGCLLLRPSSVMAFDDPENPTIIEDFIKAIGAEPAYFGMRNECCGAYTSMKDKGFAEKSAAKIIENAKNSGAEMIITACPLCMYNLNCVKSDMPVRYFTELLAEALDIK